MVAYFYNLTDNIITVDERNKYFDAIVTIYVTLITNVTFFRHRRTFGMNNGNHGALSWRETSRPVGDKSDLGANILVCDICWQRFTEFNSYRSYTSII